MLPTKKDLSHNQEPAAPIWHVPETVPSWHVPEPRVKSRHLPEPSSKSWHVPVPTQISEMERENQSPVAGRQSQRPVDLTPNTQHSSLSVKTKASMKEIPSCRAAGPQGVRDESSAEISSGSVGSSPSSGGMLRNLPSAPRKRPIPSIPPGGTLLESTPIHQPIATGDTFKESASSGCMSRKDGMESNRTVDESSTKSCLTAPSATSTPIDGSAQLGTRKPLGGSLPNDGSSIHRPILTGESVGQPSASAVPKKRQKPKSSDGQPTSSPTKMTARKSTSVKPSFSRTAGDSDSTSSKRERFILTIPPEFHFKGDPPPWIRALYLEPLLDGWKREIVERATATKKTSDVYYYSPEGRKFRSRVEIGQYLLDRGITKYSAAFNFWFKGSVLGEEFEPYEIIRTSGKTGIPLSPRKMRPSFTSPKTSSKKDKLVEKKRSSSHLQDEDLSDLGPEDYSEEGMIFDEEIEVVGTGDGQDAVFDPAVLSLRNQPVSIRNIPEIKERPKRSMPPPKKRKQPSTSKAKGTASGSAELKRFCICDDVEHGDMVLCDNSSCEIGWYHFGCVNITSAPAGQWYCPICRGASSGVMNSNIALGK